MTFNSATTNPNCAVCGTPWLGVWHACPPPGVPERNWRWVADGEFIDPCDGCEASDVTHYHRPQDAPGGPTGAATSPDGSQCHCAVLLPALRRWAEAVDGDPSWRARIEPTEALLALAREVAR